MSKFYRHGDVNFVKVEKAEGEVIKHDGSYVVARGEATGSEHRLAVKDPEDLIIKKDLQGNYYFELFSEGRITHTHDHEPLVIPIGTYKQIAEREIDWFAGGVTRKVQD